MQTETETSRQADLLTHRHTVQVLAGPSAWSNVGFWQSAIKQKSAGEKDNLIESFTSAVFVSEHLNQVLLIMQ